MEVALQIILITDTKINIKPTIKTERIKIEESLKYITIGSKIRNINIKKSEA